MIKDFPTFPKCSSHLGGVYGKLEHWSKFFSIGPMFLKIGSTQSVGPGNSSVYDLVEPTKLSNGTG